MYKYILLLFSLLIPSFTFASKLDADLMETLFNGCKVAADKFDYPKQYDLAEQLLSIAIDRNNIKFQAKALFFLGTSKLFTGRSETAMSDLQRCLKLSEEIKNDSLIALAYNSLAIYEGMINNNLNISQRYLLLAKEHAQRVNYVHLINSIYNNLSEIARQQEDPQGEEYAIIEFQQGKTDNNQRMMFLGADHLSYFKLIGGNYAEARNYFDIAKKLQEENGFLDTNTLSQTSVLLEIEEGNLELAELNANKYLAESKNLGKDDQANALYLLAKIRNLKKDYLSSNSLLEELLEVVNNNNQPLLEEKARRLMAQNYGSLGLNEQALISLSKADSLSVIEKTKEKQHLINERKLMLSIIDHEKQERLYQLREERQRTWIWILSSGAFLLIICLLGLILYFKKRDNLYRHLVANQTQIITLEEETQDLRKEILLTASLSKNNNEDENDKEAITEELDESYRSTSLNKEKSDNLYRELTRLMEEEKLYKNPTFTREELLEKLKTNRTYLSQIIKTYTGKNYSQFINSYRIKEAIKILSDPQNADYSLKNLSSEIGFMSPTTFSKLFQQAVGMSPSSFRKSAFTLNSEPL